VRKNATFARYLGAILCNLKQKKMHSSEFCVRFATEKKFVKKMMILGFFQKSILGND